MNATEQVKDAAIPMLLLALLGTAFTASALRAEHAPISIEIATSPPATMQLEILGDEAAPASDLQIMLVQSQRAFRAVASVGEVLNHYGDVRQTISKHAGK